MALLRLNNMQVTIQTKATKVIQVPKATSLIAVATMNNNLSLGQLKTVDISQAEEGDVLMLVGTKWQAESLDGGTFN